MCINSQRSRRVCDVDIPICALIAREVGEYVLLIFPSAMMSVTKNTHTRKWQLETKVLSIQQLFKQTIDAIAMVHL